MSSWFIQTVCTCGKFIDLQKVHKDAYGVFRCDECLNKPIERKLDVPYPYKDKMPWDDKNEVMMPVDVSIDEFVTAAQEIGKQSELKMSYEVNSPVSIEEFATALQSRLDSALAEVERLKNDCEMYEAMRVGVSERIADLQQRIAELEALLKVRDDEVSSL
jgi:hypothetical protein